MSHGSTHTGKCDFVGAHKKRTAFLEGFSWNSQTLSSILCWFTRISSISQKACDRLGQKVKAAPQTLNAQIFRKLATTRWSSVDISTLNAQIFRKLATTRWSSVDISPIEFYPHHTKNVENTAKFHWRPYVKYSCHSTDFHEIQNAKSHRTTPRSVKKYGNCAHKLFTPLFKLNPSPRGFSQNSLLPGNFQ